MKSSTKSGRQRPFLLLEHLTGNKRPHSSLSSCCCSLPVPINVFKHLDTNFSHSKPLSQLQHRYGPLLRLRLRLFCSFQAALLRNFNKTVRRELLIMGVQQLEDVFSILRKNFRAWTNMSCLEEKNLSAERRKPGESAGFRWPPSPYQLSRCNLFFSESDCKSTTSIRSQCGSKSYGNANCPVMYLHNNTH